MADFEIEGLDDFEKLVISIGKDFDKLEAKAIKQGAEIIRDEIEKRTPRSEFTRQPKTYDKWRLGDHASNNLKIGKLSRREGIRSVLIGTGKGDNTPIFYLKFLEWGTSKHQAQPFMESAMESRKEEAIDKVKEVISKGLIK